MSALDISKWAESVGASVDEASRAIKLEVFTGVIDDTRVDTGRLKGNWQATIDRPATGVLERNDKNGSQATAQAQQTVRGTGIDYLTNNLDYAAVYEEKDGMVAKNLARVDTIVRNLKK